MTLCLKFKNWMLIAKECSRPAARTLHSPHPSFVNFRPGNPNDKLPDANYFLIKFHHNHNQTPGEGHCRDGTLRDPSRFGYLLLSTLFAFFSCLSTPFTHTVYGTRGHHQLEAIFRLTTLIRQHQSHHRHRGSWHSREKLRCRTGKKILSFQLQGARTTPP